LGALPQKNPGAKNMQNFRRFYTTSDFDREQWRIQLWAVRAAAPFDQNLGLALAARLRHGGKFSLKSLTFDHFLCKNVQKAFSFRGGASLTPGPSPSLGMR